MDANSTHPDYDANVAKWARARDVLAGEDGVKAAGERYLPRLDSQSDDEYTTYRARASFFGATARTLEEYLDLAFRKAPEMGLGAGSGLKAFVSDCDQWGVEFVAGVGIGTGIRGREAVGGLRPVATGCHD